MNNKDWNNVPARFILREIVALYIFYVGIMQFAALNTTDYYTLSIVLGILFTVGGVGYAIYGGIHLMRMEKSKAEEKKEPESEDTPAVEEKSTVGDSLGKAIRRIVLNEK